MRWLVRRRARRCKRRSNTHRIRTRTSKNGPNTIINQMSRSTVVRKRVPSTSVALLTVFPGFQRGLEVGVAVGVGVKVTVAVGEGVGVGR